MPGNGKDFPIGSVSGVSAYQQAQLKRAGEQLKGLQPGSATDRNSSQLRTPEEQAEIKKAAQQFEALLLQQMMKAMWRTVPQDGLLSGSNEEGIYRDMLNEALSDDISKGQGVGIKEVLEREFSKSGRK